MSVAPGSTIPVSFVSGLLGKVVSIVVDAKRRIFSFANRLADLPRLLLGVLKHIDILKEALDFEVVALYFIM